MVKISIDVTQVPKDKLYRGAKGTYLNAILVEKPDDFGNAGFIAMEISKEERLAGKRGEIIGKWKIIGKGSPKRAESARQEYHDTEPNW